HTLLHGFTRELDVRIAGECRGHGRLSIDHSAGKTGIQFGQGVVGSRNHQVKCQHQVRFAGGDTHGMDVVLAVADADVADHGAELLRQAGLIQHRHPFAFDVCRHAQQRTDGHHPGATHTGEQNAVGVIARDRRWLGQGREVDIGTDAGRLLQLAALDRDKAGAETAHAGEIFVAAGLVDGALAAGVGFLGQDRQAVGLDAAVAAALAYVGVNHHPLVGVGHGAALTATTFFGGAGLIVDDYRAAFDLPQFPLNRVQVVAVVEGGAVGKVRPGRVLVDVVTDHGDSANTLAVKLVTDLLHSECAVHRLAAGHR